MWPYLARAFQFSLSGIDVYECFQDQELADQVMAQVSDDLERFTPLNAQRCVLQGGSHSGCRKT